MPWREAFTSAGGKADVILSTAGMGALAWVPLLAVFDAWSSRVMALLGILILGIRLYRQWRHRNTPPKG
jgi:hypothetical protein